MSGGQEFTETATAPGDCESTPDDFVIAKELEPAKTDERIGSLDFIRGIAVMGILAANIIAFGQPFLAYMMPSQFMVPSGDPEGWMWIAQFVLIDGKMRGLFTLLFGAGLYLFLERAWERGATRGLQVRRLAWLGVFGLLHFFFIWRGDILFLYAVCGLAALALVRMKPPNQMILGLIGYVIGALFYTALFAAIHSFAAMDVGDDADLAEAQAEMLRGEADATEEGLDEAALIQSGDYMGYVTDTITGHWWMPLVAVLQVFIETIPLMLIGMALYRMGFFEGSFPRNKMILWGWLGVVIGGALSFAIGLWARADEFSFYGTQWAFIGMSMLPRLGMILGIAALLVVYSPNWTGWIGQRVAAAGRAAFTNYLGTSIVMLFVFHGWALGLYGELNRPQLLLVWVLTSVLMLAWSKPWLERYRYGPLEWLWRCLTYGKLFPLRR